MLLSELIQQNAVTSVRNVHAATENRHKIKNQSWDFKISYHSCLNKLKKYFVGSQPLT